MTSGGPTPSLSRGPTDPPRVRWLLWLLVPLMILQAGLGIFLNLYVTLPLPSSLGTVFPVIFANPEFAAHFLLSTVLIALAVGAAVLARGPLLRRIRWVSITLALVFVGSAYAGYHFVATQDNNYSFGMEMGFLAGVGLLFYLLYLTGAFGAAAAGQGSSGSEGPSPPVAENRGSLPP